MKVLRGPGKVDMLLNMFENVGDSMDVDKVCEITGISGYNSLKALFSYIRHAKHVPDENRISVKISEGRCVRVK